MLADKGGIVRGLHNQGPDRIERDDGGGGGARIPCYRAAFTDQVTGAPFGYDPFRAVLLEDDLRAVSCRPGISLVSAATTRSRAPIWSTLRSKARP